MWAVLDRASRGWRGFTMTSDGLRLLQDLRPSLLELPRQLRPRTTSPAQASSPKLSEPPHNMTMKQEPALAHLHRIPDATACEGAPSYELRPKVSPRDFHLVHGGA